MTVCAAAIGTSGVGAVAAPMIFGASDRMLTSDDIEYEPQQTKIYPITNSVVIMAAGDSGLQAEIIQQMSVAINQRIAAHPANWWTVRDVAFLYNEYYNRELKRRAESDVLAPLGMTMDSFLQRQKQMDSTVVEKLTGEFLEYSMPETEALFAGIDPTGAHLYTALGSRLSCRDDVGFAAIGMGRDHANSLFMFSRHTRFKPAPQTMFLVFSAKKRAEVAPGVGKEGTDMFAVGPALGTYSAIPDEMITSFDKIYKENQKQIEKLGQKADKQVLAYMEKLAAEQAIQPQQKSETPSTGFAGIKKAKEGH